jgi:hypothetical protein
MAAAAETPIIALFIGSSFFSDPLMAALLSPLQIQVSHFVMKDHTRQAPRINHVPRPVSPSN